MMNKDYQYIASLCLRILIGFLLTTKPVFSNEIVDLINTIRNKSLDDIRSKPNPVFEFRDILLAIQNHLYNTTPALCHPGFHFYRGSCYSLSLTTATWESALNSCPKRPNSSLAVLKTKDELEFIVKSLFNSLKIQEAFIGLKANESRQWFWLDNRTLWDDVFGDLFYPYRPDTSHCGLIKLLDKTNAGIEGRPCVNYNAHFICQYVPEHCYGKNMCLNNGECMRIGSAYKCRCKFLYRGDRCEKVSSKAIQSIVALVLIIFMGLIGCCLKFDLCSFCRTRENRNPIDDLFNERQMILVTHEKKRAAAQY